MGEAHAPHRSPTAPQDREWDWSGSDKLDEILEHGGWQAVANAHAWWDSSADEDPPQQKGAYKLPHHELIDGRLKVVWRGVVAAMAVVNGGRGGVDIPRADLRNVYEHLADHYRQFGEDPPEFSG
ncbi:MAG TPA: hypothetical protein VM305_07900 [Candidatus Limnocylindrales bacterium]|nr:hypothetical protein [Candidatus Limnocylindrales bacterium]